MSSTRTPEGELNRCPLCGAEVFIEPSWPPGDAPCPKCGQLLWCDRSSPLRFCERVGVEDPTTLPFDVQAWFSGSPKMRGMMSRDLTRRGLLIGLTPNEVLATLGEPDEQGDGWWCYCIYRGVRITYRGSAHRLRIDFDRLDRVSEAKVVVMTIP